jgi:hypothetical protein
MYLNPMPMWELVAGHWSPVTSRWSLVAGRWSLVFARQGHLPVCWLAGLPVCWFAGLPELPVVRLIPAILPVRVSIYCSLLSVFAVVSCKKLKICPLFAIRFAVARSVISENCQNCLTLNYLIGYGKHQLQTK